jgi:hypothetical protein
VLIVAESAWLLNDNTDPPLDVKVIPELLKLPLLLDNPAIVKELTKLGIGVVVGVGVGVGLTGA